MGKPGLRSGRNLFLRLGGRLPRPGWRLRLRGPGRWSIGLRDRGRGVGAKHDIKHAAPYLVALGGRRRWWWWCAWLGHGASLVWYPSIAWSLSAARNRRLAEQHAAPASRRCCRPLAASTQEGGPAKVTRDNESPYHALSILTIKFRAHCSFRGYMAHTASEGFLQPSRLHGSTVQRDLHATINLASLRDLHHMRGKKNCRASSHETAI